MREYCVEALVLGREDFGEADSIVELYTAEFGKISAKIKSAKKITSKLSGHLEPFGLAAVRLVSRKNDAGDGRSFQIADALRADNFPFWRKSPDDLRLGLQILHFIRGFVWENQPDPDLWNFLRVSFSRAPDVSSGEGEYNRRILDILGMGGNSAPCRLCEGEAADCFAFQSNVFLCRACLLASKLPRNEIVLL
ncbi:MAG: DNA repair protein RecO [Patescibacteria group bacterium]